MFYITVKVIGCMIMQFCVVLRGVHRVRSKYNWCHLTKYHQMQFFAYDFCLYLLCYSSYSAINKQLMIVSITIYFKVYKYIRSTERQNYTRNSNTSALEYGRIDIVATRLSRRMWQFVQVLRPRSCWSSCRSTSTYASNHQV